MNREDHSQRLFPKTDLFYNYMTSPIGFLTSLDEPEYVENWIRCFAVLARVKKLKNQKILGGENEITDFWLLLYMKQ